MILTQRQWKYGMTNVYTDIEAELLNFENGIRVLPAPYFYEKNLNFTLLQRFEPGENKFYPNGGFEVRGPDGERRSFDLDQVIVHPTVMRHAQTIQKIIEGRNERKGRKPKPKKEESTTTVKTGKRGRPPLNPEEKAKREAALAEKQARSTGKRGRPKMSDEEKAKRAAEKPAKPETTGTGKRGRPSLSPEEKAKREAAKAATTKKSGGKRGRPRKYPIAA